MRYCAPQQTERYDKTGSCYDKTALAKIARAFNRAFPENTLRDIDGKTFTELWKELHKKLSKWCGKDEVCWVSRVGLDYDPKMENYVRPKTPADWRKDPKTWLTNFNIEAVMFQYEAANKPIYEFLGVYPVDFRSTKYTNTCLYEETCTFNIEDLYQKGIRYVGMIINLDKHDEPGSHWTSLFICIDPKLTCYGAYYYDSVTGEPPEEMLAFMKDVRTQAEAFRKKMKLRKKFKLEYNNHRHQFGHSECGLFAMYYQIKWIHELKKKKGNVTFEEIVGPKITDGEVTELRKLLFRPLYEFKKDSTK